MGKIYTFKEITDQQELEQFFRLRYAVYSQSANKIFLKENEHRIDIDYYDIHSRHYCLMQGNDKAGYLRVVLPKEELTNENVMRIGEHYSLLEWEAYIQQNETAPFPFLSYNGVPKSHWDYYNDLLTRNEKLAEASRLILHPDFRTIRTSKFLVECAIALYILVCIGQKHAIINCDVEHSLFYEHYGFKTIDGNGGYAVNGLNKISLALAISLSFSSVPRQYHERIESMAKEYRTTGKIIREL